MQQNTNETPKRVLARVLAHELDAVQGGMPAQQTYFSGDPGGIGGQQSDGTNSVSYTDANSFGANDTDQL
jgi:hypothetical protein